MSSAVLGGLAFERTGRLQPRARLSATQECRDQNAQMVTRPNVAARIRDTSPPRGAAIMARHMRGNTRSPDALSVVFGLAEGLGPEAFITSPVSHACSGAIAPMRRAMSG